jgi:hypothetical protein
VLDIALPHSMSEETRDKQVREEVLQGTNA